MRRLMTTISSLFIAVLILFGISVSEVSATPDRDLVRLNFPTATTTGTIYPLGAAMANLWNSEIDYVRFTAQASDGGIDNLNLLRQGDGDISFANTNIIVDMMEGTGAFEGRPYDGIRVVAGLYINPNQFVAREGAGLESIGDIKGKDFAPGAMGSTPYVESDYILSEYGIDFPDDINQHLVGFTEAIDLMRNNQIDGALIMGGVPTAAVTEMTATADGKLLSIEEDVREKLKEKYPWYADYTIPADTYDNQSEDIHTLGVSITLMADKSVPVDVIYDLTKVFWEKKEKIEDAHPIVERMDVKGAATGIADLPLHPGAKKYYKEIDISME